MGYGLGVFLIAIGLILSFAVNIDIAGINRYLIGMILAGAGLLVLILTALQANARRRSSTTATTTHADGSQTVQRRDHDV